MQLVQAMVWCRQAKSHYLSQCWSRSCRNMASLGHNIPVNSNNAEPLERFNWVNEHIHKNNDIFFFVKHATQWKNTYINWVGFINVVLVQLLVEPQYKENIIGLHLHGKNTVAAPHTAAILRYSVYGVGSHGIFSSMLFPVCDRSI